METNTRERRVPGRTPLPTQAPASTPIPIDNHGISATRSTPPMLHGCARLGCLEVAQLQADYCPLHTVFPGSGDERSRQCQPDR
jgi:hypothetical protein